MKSLAGAFKVVCQIDPCCTKIREVGEPCSLRCGCLVRAEMEQLHIWMKYMVSFHLYNTTNIENMGLNGAIYNHIEIDILEGG
jgi:hypothetical protein